MYYRKLHKYKYQVVEKDEDFPTKIYPDEHIINHFLVLKKNGLLIVRKGYCWDGPSGPTIDTKTFMRGSLVHDALYQLINNNKISRSYRKQADELLRCYCLLAKMKRLRAWYVYWAVRFFGGVHLWRAKRKEYKYRKTYKA